jgi:hypothetical protein
MDGLRVWHCGATSTSPPSPWPTRTPGSSGHCWHMIETTRRSTSRNAAARQWPSQRCKCNFSKTLPPQIAQALLKVMASQVRPGPAQPASSRGPQQSALLIRRRPAYSIRARGQEPHQRPDVWLQSPPVIQNEESAWHRGASMYVWTPTRAGRYRAAHAPRRLRSP